MPNNPSPSLPDDLSELLAIAEAGTPGPWFVEESETMWELYAANGAGHPLKLAKCPKVDPRIAEYWPEPQDARFMTTFHPGVVAALLRELQHARQKLAAAGKGARDGAA